MTEALRLYIAGPMTGLPQFNFPAFEKMAAELRAIPLSDGISLEVISPAEMDDESTRAAALASLTGDLRDVERHGTWGDFLARDVKLIADDGITGIVVLPGWEKSSGARLETFVAHLRGLPVVRYMGNGNFHTVPLDELTEAWRGR